MAADVRAIVERVERCSSPGYFFCWQTLVAACHWPPAFSQSAMFVIVDNDLPFGDPAGGLADGDVGEPVEGVGDEPEGELGLLGVL
jgi:hypothetical protein